jgi:hypothetical protein
MRIVASGVVALLSLLAMGGAFLACSGSSAPAPSEGSHASSSGSGGSSGSSGGSSGSSGGATDPDAGDSLQAARVECVQTINADRATLMPASPPLTEGTAAQESCVDGQAKADYAANTPHAAFGQCQESAQDECPGWPGPPTAIMSAASTSCLYAMWAEGPPPAGQDNHWLNMSNSSYTTVACGFYQDPQGTWWATQDFW